MQWYSSMHILPLHRVLLTVASLFINFPPQSPTCNSSHQCIPSPSQSSCHDCKSFSKLPPQKLCMQWYSSMHILPFHRVLVTIASHFLNFPPPKALHAMVVLNAHPSLSQSSCHDCKSFSKLPPPQSSACNGSPQCTSFPCIEFFSRLQVIFINFPPPKALHTMVFLNAHPSLS